MPALKIEKLVYGGKGLARSEPDGKIYFVAGVLPGEEVEVHAVSMGKNFTEAQTVSVIKSSPARVHPPCPLHVIPTEMHRVFCGGCDFQHIKYPEQLRLKKEILMETIHRIAGIDSDGNMIDDVVPSPEEFRCRNKAIIPFAPSDSGGGIKAGFYAERSHDIVEAADCLVQKEVVFRIVDFVRSLAPCLGIGGYVTDDTRGRGKRRPRSRSVKDSGDGSLRHLSVRVNERGEALVIFVVNPTEGYPARYEKLCRALLENFKKDTQNKIVGVLVNENPACTNVIFNPHNKWRTLYGADYITEYLTLGVEELKLRVSKGGFFQVNTSVAGKLYSAVQDMLFPSGFQSDKNFSPCVNLLDLYGGVGGFSIAFALRKDIPLKDIICVEENETAVRDALVNAASYGIDNIVFYALPAEDFLSSKSVGKLKKDTFAVVDPPRSGLSEKAMEGLITKISPRRFVYVSCDAATFARDMKKILSRGYMLEGKIRPFDMFPQTHHIETAACFVKARRS